MEADEILADRRARQAQPGRRWARQRGRDGEADKRSKERLDVDRGDTVDVAHRGIDVEVRREIHADAGVEIGPTRPIVEVVEAGDVVAGGGFAVGAYRGVERARGAARRGGDLAGSL